MLRRVEPYWLWAVLSVLPALWFAEAMLSQKPRIIHILVHPSGEWAARLLIVTLAITPLSMLLKGTSTARWLRANRRYFGVAAFAYALVHTIFYLIDKASFARVVTELPRFYIWTGWLAFAIFVPLAATSMDWAIRKLGPRWKKLQRWVYAAAVLTLLHWASLHGWRDPMAAIVHFAPLAALEAYRIQHGVRRRRAAGA